MSNTPKNNVTLDLQLAGYQTHLDEQNLPGDIQTEYDRFLELTDPMRKGIRVGVAKTLPTNIEKEFPILAHHYQKYLQGSIQKRTEITDSLSHSNQALATLPPGLSFRPKQIRFFEKLSEYFSSKNDGFRHRRSGFVKYPTGMGKTVMIGAIIRAINEGKRISERPKVLVLSPRDVINTQNENTIRTWNDPTLDIKDVQEIQNGKQPDVTIATYNLAALESNRLDDSRSLGDYDLILLDECHRSFGPGVLNLLRKRYPESVIIGLSATPYLGATQDAKKLRSALEYFEGEIDALTLKDGCEDGDLAPIRAQWVRVNNEKFTSEDSSDSDLIQHLDLKARTRVATQIAKEHIPHGERGIIFCTGITHSKDTAISLNEAGISAAHVDGSMNETERNQILADFRAGKYQFVTNSDLLIEGFDDDAISHAIMLRPTMSVWMYEQMIGRAARLNPNDPSKITTVWDLVGQHSNQCTILGLHRLYGDHKEAYQNGEIIFGENRDSTSSPTKDGEKRKPSESGTAIGDDAMLLDFVTVEEVGVIRVPMTAEYFTKENVLADLKAFAKTANKDVKKLMTTDNQISSTCTNGERITWGAYAGRAGVSLGMCKTANEGWGNAEIIQRLKEITGIFNKITPITAEYFTPKNILADLTAFANAMGINRPEGLKVGNISITAVCGNGETLSLNSYLYRAGIYLNICETAIEASRKRAEILKKLKEIAGVNTVSMPIEYFTQENVLADLTAFANAAGKTIITIKASEKESTSATCSNGEIISYAAYLGRYAVASMMSITPEESSGKRAEILKKLKEIAKVKVMSAEYFTPENVLADLTAYANAAGKTIQNLNTSDTTFSAMCINGEKLSFGTYLRRYVIALEENKTITNETPEKLKKIAAITEKITIVTFRSMSAEYFTPENVLADLTAFANAAGKITPEKLSTSDLKIAKCSNGEVIGLRVYCGRFGVTHGMCKKPLDAIKKMVEILKILKEISVTSNK